MLPTAIRRAESSSLRVSSCTRLSSTTLATPPSHIRRRTPRVAYISQSALSRSGSSSFSQWTDFISPNPNSPTSNDLSLKEAAQALTRATKKRKPTPIANAYREFRQAFIDAGALTSEKARELFQDPSDSLNVGEQSRWSWRRRAATNHGPLMSIDVFQTAIQVLSGSRLPPGVAPPQQDVELAAEILQDLTPLYNIQPLIPLHPFILAGMTQVDPQLAFLWLTKLETLAIPHSPVTEDDYVTLVESFISHDTPHNLPQVFDHLRTTSLLQPTAQIWRPYLSHLMPNKRNGWEYTTALDEALSELSEVDGINLTSPILADLVMQRRIATGRGAAQAFADELRGTLDLGAPSMSPDEQCVVTAALVRYHRRIGGHDAALVAAVELRDAGFPHGSSTLNILVAAKDSPIVSADDLINAAHELDIVEIETYVWSTAVHRALRREGSDALNRALEIYNESRLREVAPSVDMVDPLIHRLCARSNPPVTEYVDKALEIYYDLRDAQASRETTTMQLAAGPARKPYKPLDPAIYLTLLRGVARSRPPSQQSSDLVIQLLIDMKYFYVNLPPSFIVNSVLTELMRVSDSHDTAFKIWTYISELDESVLSDTGYPKVLKAFAGLSFEDDPLPSQSHYLDVVRRMRDTGAVITPFVYTTLFNRYATLAKNSAPRPAVLPPGSDVDLDPFEATPADEAKHALRMRLLEAVRRLHLTLRIDASLTPDVVLMNSVMNAYNHLGAYREAFTVWEHLTLGAGSLRFNDASVSIALDVCGFAGDLDGANSVWRRARGEKRRGSGSQMVPFVTTLNCWTSLIECRWRCGNPELAFAAFREMVFASRDEREVIPWPDMKCVTTMLAFARSFGGDYESKAMQIVETKLPDIYLQIVVNLPPSDERTSSSTLI